LSAKDGGQRKLHGLRYKGPLDKTTVAITGQGDLGHQHAFQKNYYFFLPRNRTVFDINIEAFQQKPWRQHGIDLTDYFNFGLDEEGWRKYCFGMKQFTQGARSLAEKSSGMDQVRHSLEGLSVCLLRILLHIFVYRNHITILNLVS
uniref:Pre-mRNA polyadenylation factor Fip1 domain-containing protein n=1 Tax=Aegilops tauschii subsp. strangulata TaxID=200361 RepID=A0A453I8J7_AEGTS